MRPGRFLRGLPLLAALLAGPAQAAGLTASNTPGDIAHAIAACWHPPREGDEITVRMSFRRDGSVFGRPRITHMKAIGDLDEQAALATSIYSAVAACSPLRFTPSFGAAIAGRILLIRFVAPHLDQRAALANHWSS